MVKAFQHRKFFCVDPTTPSCRKGFLTHAGFTQHCNAVHNVPACPSRLPQHPFIPNRHLHPQPLDAIHNPEVHDEPDGPYFIQHPVLDGTPCDEDGNDLLEGTDPPPVQDEHPDMPWYPFQGRDRFELADLIFCRNKMSKNEFNNLMHIWANIEGRSPPFRNVKELHDVIDSIPYGDAPWQNFTICHTDADQLQPDDPSVPPWKLAEYEVWFHNPRDVLRNQLSNPNFKDHIDYAPKQVFGEHNQRVWSDFMSGNWAWNQCNIVAEDEDCHGAMFVPVILGSDKTTVSVATGNNEYYPLYISTGNVHNSIRHSHREAVSIVGFLSIPKCDKDYHEDKEFKTFRRHLFHKSIEAILEPLCPSMSKPEITRCPDGHFRRVIYGIGPYIANYPEQCLLASIVQQWCAKCTARRKHFDEEDIMITPRSHCLTKALIEALTSGELWEEYGIADNILPFTASFPQADIHELLAPDLLHQVIKGAFEDHLVEITYGKRRSKKILAEIDRRIAIVPSFPGLRRFPQGRDFNQWTGDDSKALMKVYLAAISGLIPDQMVHTIAVFMDFCYIVRCPYLDEADLAALDDSLQHFYQDRSIFEETGVCPNRISLPHQHALKHYHQLIILFGAPNGLCSSITKSKHIDAVKEPWRRSSQNQPLGEILLINQRQDKLAMFHVIHLARHLMDTPLLPPSIQPIPSRDDSNICDAEAADGPTTNSTVILAKTAEHNYPDHLPELGDHIGYPQLVELVQHFLYDQRNPNALISGSNVDLSLCPEFHGKVQVFHLAVACFWAPSDLCGVGGMHRERICATPSWRNGPARHDCIFLENNPTLPGFQGLYVAQVVGDSPCPRTHMWIVAPEFDDDSRLISIVHLDSIMRPADLIPVYGPQNIDRDLLHTDSLSAFASFYVNKYSDYHAFEIAY
ncbi:uncharacterized protein F5147DRAFT_742178 [Suillus discolor]|uniref:C2H2-type domain-containing protein n=1 Tax=Suillus discolor TaxID=1912936 RepID=A0A9P7FK29_9AGAM|nr:uncharacterized protein F5147DRAFT_742178 [Suillus discolor]KAG2118670.1 hypothetical protein F5147DRAFT_742178 [Suillus discolor]